MIITIFKQWMHKKAVIGLMIFGFFIGSLVLSIGTSLTVESINYTYDQYSGDPDEQMIIDINGNNFNNISTYIKKCSNYGEVQLINMDKAVTGDYEKNYQIVPVYFNARSNWNIPIIQGRYFTDKDMKSTIKTVIIGKEISKNRNIGINDKIKINRENYTVIGITGREVRGTQWDNIIYTSWSGFEKNCKSFFEHKTKYELLLKSGKEKFLKDSQKLIEEAHNNGIEITYEMLNESMDTGSISNTIIMAALSAGLILFIAIINVVNLMVYWILERKKEFGLLKALGATKRYVMMKVIVETVIISVIASILALIVQWGLVYICEDIIIKNEININITYINLLVSVLVTAICGVVSSIIPANRTLKIQPVEAISEE